MFHLYKKHPVGFLRLFFLFPRTHPVAFFTLEAPSEFCLFFPRTHSVDFHLRRTQCSGIFLQVFLLPRTHPADFHLRSSQWDFVQFCFQGSRQWVCFHLRSTQSLRVSVFVQGIMCGLSLVKPPVGFRPMLSFPRKHSVFLLFLYVFLPHLDCTRRNRWIPSFIVCFRSFDWEGLFQPCVRFRVSLIIQSSSLFWGAPIDSGPPFLPHHFFLFGRVSL